MKKVYIAGGWFNKSQTKAIEDIKFVLLESNLIYYSPQDELEWKLGMPTEGVVNSNLNAIKDSSFVIASTLDKDMGTIFECGYATKAGKDILYYAPGLSGPFNIMLAGTGYSVSITKDELNDNLIDYLCGVSKEEYKGDME